MAIFNLNFLLKVGQVEMCQNPSPISTLVLVHGSCGSLVLVVYVVLFRYFRYFLSIFYCNYYK